MHTGNTSAGRPASASAQELFLRSVFVNTNSRTRAEQHCSSAQHSGDRSTAALPSQCHHCSHPRTPLQQPHPKPPRPSGAAATNSFWSLRQWRAMLAEYVAHPNTCIPQLVQTDVFKCRLRQTNSNDNTRYMTTSVRHTIPILGVI